MDDREKAIVMAYTGVVMLIGDKLDIFYQYIREKLGHCVMTHELAFPEVQAVITDAAKNDFIELANSNDASIVSGWISVKDRLPEDDRAVLAVKQLKNGQRDMCLARCIPDSECYDIETGCIIKRPHWVCGGNNNIIYWMPLPDIPKEDT